MDNMKQKRLILDVKGTKPGDFILFGYKDFTYEELLVILDKFKAIVETQKI